MVLPDYITASMFAETFKSSDHITVQNGSVLAYEFVPGALTSGLLLICDHASNALPPEYGSLGLPPCECQRHIAYDPGAAEITRALAAMLGAPAILSRYSRLLIDMNRGEDDPTLVMRISDGALIPGNARITRDEIAHRITQYYRPYHEAITRTLDAMIATGKPPVIFSAHSFTENWRGWMRPWHTGVLWDNDPRLAMPLLAALRADPSLVVGDNEPYSGGLEGASLDVHGTARGLAHCELEMRQDLVRHASGQTAWAERIGGILRGLLNNPQADATLHTIRHYGARARR